MVLALRVFRCIGRTRTYFILDTDIIVSVGSREGIVSNGRTNHTGLAAAVGVHTTVTVKVNPSTGSRRDALACHVRSMTNPNERARHHCNDQEDGDLQRCPADV